MPTSASSADHFVRRRSRRSASSFSVTSSNSASTRGRSSGLSEIQGLQWDDYHDGEMQIGRSIWNGHTTEPKTRKGRAPVPVIRQLAERLEVHRLRSRDTETGKLPESGPIFANSKKKHLSLIYVTNKVILPTLNRCVHCGKPEGAHPQPKHDYKRDPRFPEWHGWHAARRGLGSNLYRLGVPDMVIQRILRHANVSTTATYYIKTAADDVRTAMAKLESSIPAANSLTDTLGTLNNGQSAQRLAVQ